jgi:large subunit ribosomal protein L16
MKIKVYKKIHKIKISSLINKKLSTIKYGLHGLKVVKPGILTAKQIETARRVISRETKRVGKVFIRVFFNLPITKKPLLSRMGKGCGPIKN